MSKQASNTNVILYRLDAIERRLDNVEKHLHGGGHNPDVVRILLDLVKNGQGQGHQSADNNNDNIVSSVVDALLSPPKPKGPTTAKATTSASVASVATSASVDVPTSSSSLSDVNYDNLVCMARRRTIV
jgi:hypothetical protein